jgi:hypothetical protein
MTSMPAHAPLLMAAAAMVALLAAAAPAQAACPHGLPIGRIDRVEAPADGPVPQQVAADGRRMPARVYQWLCAGDRFELAGSAQVVAVLAGGVTQTFHAGAPGPVSGGAAATGGPRMLDVLSQALDRLAAPRKPIALFSQARDPGQAQPPLVADPLLPAGPQKLPPGTTQVTLLWRGGPGIVALLGEGGRPLGTVSSGRRAYATVALPAGGTPTALRLADQDLAWPLVWAGDLPDLQRLPDDEAVAASVAMLRDGPADRALWALSELARRAAQGHFAAEQLWAAARSGELAAALGRP